MHIVLVSDPQGNEQVVGPFASLESAQQWFMANLCRANQDHSQIMELDNPALVPADSVHADYLDLDMGEI